MMMMVVDDVEDVAHAPKLDHGDNSHKHQEPEGDNDDKDESDIDHDEAGNDARVGAQDNVQGDEAESDIDHDGDNNDALPTNNGTYDVSEDRDAYDESEDRCACDMDGILGDDTEEKNEMFCISYLSSHLEYVEYRMGLDDYAAEYPLEH